MSQSAFETSNTVKINNHLGQLTLDEKISMLAGANTWETFPIDRLGIPSLKVTDGPNGARGEAFYDGTTAACFPACVSIAATFNRELAWQIGQALGEEAQTKGAYVLLGPTVCSHRSPLGGRNFEAFSEDPALSGILAAEYVKGLQSERVGATIKHFLGNEQDTRRFSVNETISERALREIYLRPFEIVVKTAKPWCLMTSYPKINGEHVDTSKEFLNDILRAQWGFDGLVMSDWGATTSTVDSIDAGLDLEMPGKTRWRAVKTVKKALEAGVLHESVIDDRARAVLQLLERTGKFSDRKEAVGEKAVNSPKHRKLIREAGAEGIVLLKNSNGVLPIDSAKCQKIALLGPLAKVAGAHGGGSASLNCHYKISPYEALNAELGDSVDLTYSKGTHIFRVYPDLQEGTIGLTGNPGYTAEYWKNEEFRGDPFCTQEFARGYFTTLMDAAVDGKKAVRFTTNFSPKKSGNHYLSYSTLGPSKLYINGALYREQIHPSKDSMSFLLGVQEEMRFQFLFDAGKSYAFQIDTLAPAEPNGELYLLDGQISAHLGFIEQEEMEADLLAEAVSLAQDADYAILFVGNDSQWETEGQDMDDMNLPADGSQNRLISAVAKVNSNTIVVNVTGVAVTTPWLSEVPALVQVWYAGQETGNSILDVLLGKVNPSGKLPISWPRRYEDTAVYGHFGMDSYDSRQVEYVEGVFVGYRHFDKQYGTDKEVLFPFGYGLSYTDFEISSPAVSGTIRNRLHDSALVTAQVGNIGAIAGAEVVQAYILPPRSGSAEHPIKGLVGFSKVFIQPGEKKSISIPITRDHAAYWDISTKKWVVDKGVYKIWLATSASVADKKCEIEIEVTEAFAFDP
ncbi:Beta-D-glucoside glucohydrolase B [Hyphodiscus hymeniophilus]|uniref:beta-glucosidase n=1 Tax=Hyphodiscus hymeniophilus TaxID=353542 RepID=A0A9P6VND8_9HELO|nr:Beta-D-glucoside glucohydrolase B [Hyphodiscus hymeniophilus]